jgi:hypothetical protein
MPLIVHSRVRRHGAASRLAPWVESSALRIHRSAETPTIDGNVPA